MAIRLEPQNTNLGTIVVGYDIRKKANLVNQSDGILRYSLMCWESGSHVQVNAMVQTGEDDSPHDSAVTLEQGSDDVIISVDEPEGTISSRLTDAFCDGWSKPFLWDMMSAEGINTEAASVVSDIEKRMEQLEVEGKVTNDEVLKALDPFCMDFGVSAIGSAPVAVHFELSNPGNIPAVWELHSHDQPDVEMERWVDPGRPRNEQEKLRDFIVENRIFQIDPRSGDLMPGDRVHIKTIYTPLAEGTHSLPILLRVRDGKRIRLQLEGRTVPPDTMHLALTPATRSFDLRPVPLGCLQPPRQMYCLHNGGPGVLKYELDLTNLEKLTRENYSFEVLRFEGRSSAQEKSLWVEFSL
ncbi:unnamed protein product [Ostreobium quekettii]|uniref:Uncharacterized protein n=1 Tax=Ostreobium quekettii TaxID=121088 RepID=A0A8S1JF60_9CHLO|nr:unnamed protein product [Ostreobium quekettii]